jgi:DNA helicase IV
MGYVEADRDALANELAIEQAHVDRVYAELVTAGERAALVQEDGLARGRTDRTGDVRDEETTGLFERDALVYRAARRRADLDREHEGLVFGRLDLQHSPESGGSGGRGPAGREVRYVGRLGVRDDDYEPLVIDWRAPAAEPFYRATPTAPMGVLRRRVLRCRGQKVIGAEDDLMVAEAPDDLVVLGEGALLAALARSRSGRMRDIVATIQAHQDEAIRAAATGVVEITGGPGTGKTVVALHRAAYLLYSDRRRFERGGGPRGGAERGVHGVHRTRPALPSVRIPSSCGRWATWSTRSRPRASIPRRSPRSRARWPCGGCWRGPRATSSRAPRRPCGSW